MTTTTAASGGFFMVPVALIDLLDQIKSLAELKIILYVFRHTWGFQEFTEAKRITTDELMDGRKKSDGERMDKGIGMAKQSVLSGERAAIKHGILICEGREGDKANHYRVNFPPPPKVQKVDQNGLKVRPTREKQTQKYTKKQTQKDSALSRLLSFPSLSSKIGDESLRSSPWNVETILALSSKVLNVPDPQAVEESGDAQVIETMYQEYIHPARWLYEQVDVDPRFAWERIERHLRAMTDASSPSWWVQKRSRNSPITLRHVVGKNGENWRVVSAELEKHAWYPSVTTQYFGPPLIEEEPAPYSHGYTGSSVPPVTVTEEPEMAMTPPLTEDAAQSSEEAAESTEIDEVPPNTEEVPAITAQSRPSTRMPGMTPEVAESLVAAMHAEFPELRLGFVEAEDDPDLLYVGVEIAPNQWIDIKSPKRWLAPSAQLAALIETALIYGAAQANAMIGNEKGSEVDAAKEITVLEGG